MLEINFNICTVNNCTSIRFNDLTGLESECNPTGWSPGEIGEFLNPSIGMSIASIIIKYGEIQTEINLDNFPTNQTCKHYIIDSESVLPSWTVFPDGYYEVTYKVTNNGVNYTKTKKFYFYCGVQCCIDKLAASITINKCGQVSDSTNTYLTAYSLLQSLKLAAKKEDTIEFNTILKTLQKFCNLSNCGCGCK
jgi:hypothetical protein